MSEFLDNNLHGVGLSRFIIQLSSNVHAGIDEIEKQELKS